VATPADNARLYFKFRPTRLRLGTDPELSTHRAYGLPRPVPNGEFMEAVSAVRVNPFGDLPEPLSVPEASHAINTMDKYEPTAADQADLERQFPQLKGQFLIDRDGIVRWANIECSEGISGVGKFPADDVILAAAKTL
jgi:hypothetical protein